jgi:hypothetical protein
LIQKSMSSELIFDFYTRKKSQPLNSDSVDQ